MDSSDQYEYRTDNPYLKLITSQHKDKPKFLKTVDLSTAPLVHIQDTLYNIIDAHYLDNAQGAQLDTLGEWIGQSRTVKIPLTDIYFAFDTIADSGWDSGIWWDTYSPMDGTASLDDDSYRFILKMRVASNRWHGKRDEAYDIWQQTFGGTSFVLITDYQDMSIDIGFSGKLSAAVKAIIKAGLQPFKPESVQVRAFFTNNADGPMFGWDIENDAINGYDSGNWADIVTGVKHV